MRRSTIILVTLLIVGVLGACGDSSGDDNSTRCDPVCSADMCMVCGTSDATATCRSACGDGTTCQAGECLPPEETRCEPACGNCQVCDISSAVPECVSMCAEGLTCEGNVCQPPVIPDPPSCATPCSACEVCDVSGATPECVSICGNDRICSAAGACVRAAMHASLTDLQGPFTSGPEVTAACLGCHEDVGNHILDTAHWKWAGDTPQMAGYEDANTVGKRNLVDNFFIAVTSNEERCSQCHTGYGMQDQTFDYGNPVNIDCLVCHADPAAGYKKDPAGAGAPIATADLVLAAQSVGVPSRTNCGSCHFDAGGGDNVKKGDLGSALANPTVDTDAHMGKGMTCVDCHRGASHTVLGQGAHLPVTAGRIFCTGCHTSSPHSVATLNEHALDIACQTCHIPAFSRQQPTLTNWNWSTAGNKTLGTAGVVTGTLSDGSVVETYHFMKGDLLWEKNVKPTYAWYDGRVERMTTLDQYAAGEGTVADPIKLGSINATHSDMGAKIFPFKTMKGQQPIDPTARYVIVPKLYGPGGFWEGIPDAGDYTAGAIETLWTNALTAGALAADQLAVGPFYGPSDWSWGYTVMYLSINHEVAPKEQALGQATGCTTDCHGTGTVLDFAALGYSCDPMTGSGCGSRH